MFKRIDEDFNGAYLVFKDQGLQQSDSDVIPFSTAKSTISRFVELRARELQRSEHRQEETPNP